MSITLTYPAWYRVDPETAKKDLEKFRKRVVRRFGEHATIWRLEFQGSPVPHFHLIMFFNSPLPVSKAKLAEIRGFVARAWHEVSGRISDEHLRAGTRVERPRSLLRALKYLAKAEPCENDTGSPKDVPPQRAGRRWGVWRRELLVVWVETRVSLKNACRIRRSLRRLLGLQSRPGVVTFTAFVRDDHVVRLLALFGSAVPS